MADEIIIETVSTEVIEVGVVGPQGPAGSAGAAGPANTLSIGTVTSGETAAATITGAAPSQTLSLVLPKGDKGDKGDPGDNNAFDQSLNTSDTPTFAGLTVEGTAIAGQTPDTVLRGGAWFGGADGTSGVGIYKETSYGGNAVAFTGANEAITQYNNIIFAATSQAQLYLATSGNVGLGVVDPSQKLDVNGNAALRDTVNEHSATFNADNKLSASRTYDLPDADGKIIVSASTPDDGDALVWDDATAAWVAAAPTGGVTSYNDLDDLPTLGTAAAADIGTGAGDVCAGDDARLSDARTPTSHTHEISDVTGLQTALDGKQASGSYAAATHTHAASDITSGTFDIARIPTGTGSAQVALGDHTHSDATTTVAGFLSAADKVKLDSVASGAEANVQANWTESNSASDAFILNKPTLGTAAAASTSDFAAASHSHELTALAATGATNGHVLTANGSGGVTFAAASGGGFGEVRFDTATVYTYTGQAAEGSSESSAVWFIRRSEFSSAGSYVSTTTANNVQWANRLTASYS